jgi:hypothetical protein
LRGANGGTLKSIWRGVAHVTALSSHEHGGAEGGVVRASPAPRRFVGWPFGVAEVDAEEHWNKTETDRE